MLIIRDEQFQILKEKCGDVQRSNAPVQQPPPRSGLTIRQEQMSALSEYMKERFVSETIKLLSKADIKWSNSLSPEDKVGYLQEVISMAESNGITKESSIQKLALLRIEFGYSIPLSQYHSYLLNRSEFFEEYRLEAFRTALIENKELSIIDSYQ